MATPKGNSSLPALDLNAEIDTIVDEPVSRRKESKEGTTVSTKYNSEEEEFDQSAIRSTRNDIEINTKSASNHSISLNLVEDEQNVTKKHSAPSLNDNISSKSSIEFESLMQFPSCPTTLPRLDTHFNFAIDHDIKSPDSSNIDWSAIHQEMEYDHQKLTADNHHSNIGDSTMNITADQQLHPLLLLHQLQQDNLSIMFSNEEGDFSPISSVFSLDCKGMNNENITAATAAESATIQQKMNEKDENYNGVTTPTPFHCTTTTDAAILFVENEEFNEKLIKKELQDETLFNINIEDLLLLPSAPIPPRPSLSSPGQLFKSKFQKAVRKMKKSSPNFSKHEDTMTDKMSSMYSDESSRKASSLQLHSYFPHYHHRQPQQEDPLFSAALSPRPSASARVQGHLKGQLNKLFRK